MSKLTMSGMRNKIKNNRLLGVFVFNKYLFVETMNEIEKQYNHDHKCSEAFKVILPNDNTSIYANHWLKNQLIKILQIAMNDNNKNSWIEYYIHELEFGRRWKEGSVMIDGKDFKLQNARELWDLLNINKPTTK